MAPTFEDYYASNPISVIDQNTWDDRLAEVEAQFLRMPTIYTPLITWIDRSQVTGAETSKYTDLLVGDANADELGMSAMYIEEPLGVDSRERGITVTRYGDKVQLHKVENVFQQWIISPEGNRDWRGVLRGVLGENIREKFEIISRNIWLKGPKSFWTYGGTATNFSGLNNTAKFGIDIVNAWNLRIGQTGAPVIPGDHAGAKVCVLPPGAVFDFMSALAASTANEAKLWIDFKIYAEGTALKNEIGSWRDVRFIQVPNDRYGMNRAVLYNAGPITIQSEVSAAITRGDGAPDPEVTQVDLTWRVGQKGATHYIQLAALSFTTEYEVNDLVSIHTLKTADYGVTGGVDFMSGKTIVRRIVDVDVANQRLSFDRPIMASYSVDLGTSVFAYVTKATHVGFCLVLGSREGVKGNVNKPLQLYTPKPIDDFESVWRFVWDFIGGLNIWEPHMFECHFVAVTLPKPGGLILPPAP